MELIYDGVMEEEKVSLGSSAPPLERMPFKAPADDRMRLSDVEM